MSDKDRKYYFCGISGCGMNPLAHLLAREGFSVRGSDMAESSELDSLRKDGIECYAAQDGSQPKEGEIFVYTSAIREDNGDMQAAKRLGLELMHRSELLAEMSKSRQAITVSGAHGKTTVSSLISVMLADGGLDPAAVVGGFVPAFKGNFRAGKGPFVLEADESDGTFRRYTSQDGVILNVDRDHLDFYSGIEEIAAAFKTYADHIANGGRLFFNSDDPICRDIAASQKGRLKIVPCGQSEDAEYSFGKVSFGPTGSCFSLAVRKAGKKEEFPMESPLPGLHNVFNAVMAAAVAMERGVSPGCIARSLKSFSNARRRFEFLGTWKGAAILDDYAHHPRELAALLDSLSRLPGEKTFVFQPHRFSRTEKLLDEFAEVLMQAPNLVLTEVYSAGEKPDGEGSLALLQALRRAGKELAYIEDPMKVPAYLETLWPSFKKPHTIVMAGAGALSRLAHEMLAHKSEEK